MLTYAAKRFLHALLVLWAAFTGTFFLLYALPGDAALNKAGVGSDASAMSSQQLAQLKAELGLDQPIIVQYWHALIGAVHGDFGRSLQTGRPASEQYFQALPETLKLAATALILGLALGICWALLATYVRWGPLRQALLALPAVGVAIPTFWVGLVMIQFVSFKCRMLPAIGNQGIESLIMPAIVLAIPIGAMSAQVLSRSLEQTMRAPYIETARSRGASRGRIVIGQALQNSIIPVVTTLGMTVGHLIGGSVVVETVFSRAGVGALTVRAVDFQDTPVVLVSVTFAAAIFVTINFVVDLLYPIIDPRIRLRARRVAATAPLLAKAA